MAGHPSTFNEVPAKSSVDALPPIATSNQIEVLSIGAIKSPSSPSSRHKKRSLSGVTNKQQLDRHNKLAATSVTVYKPNILVPIQSTSANDSSVPEISASGTMGPSSLHRNDDVPPPPPPPPVLSNVASHHSTSQYSQHSHHSVHSRHDSKQSISPRISPKSASHPGDPFAPLGTRYDNGICFSLSLFLCP